MNKIETLTHKSNIKHTWFEKNWQMLINFKKVFITTTIKPPLWQKEIFKMYISYLVIKTLLCSTVNISLQNKENNFVFFFCKYLHVKLFFSSSFISCSFEGIWVWTFFCNLKRLLLKYWLVKNKIYLPAVSEPRGTHNLLYLRTSLTMLGLITLSIE